MADPVIEELLAAREHNRAIAPPSEQRRLALAEAYAVQDRLRDALVARGERVIGWKAGFTNKALQTAYACEEPVCGFLLASGVFPNRAEVPFARFASLVVEAEVAFVLKHDLVMSGSVSTLLRPKAGDTVRATFTRLGSVAVRFA